MLLVRIFTKNFQSFENKYTRKLVRVRYMILFYAILVAIDQFIVNFEFYQNTFLNAMYVLVAIVEGIFTISIVLFKLFHLLPNIFFLIF